MKIILNMWFMTMVTVLSGQQYLDLVKFEYDHGLPQSFDTPESNSGSVSEMALDLTLPLVISPEVSILTGLNSEWIKVNIYEDQAKQNLYGIMLKLGINLKHSSKWSGTYLLLPKISSDLSGIDNRAFQLGGIGLLKYTKSKSFNYKLGLYLNSDLFGPMIVPIFGLYRNSGKWETNLNLPLNADIGYQFKPNMKLGVRFVGINKSYHLDQSPEQYVVKINNEIGPYWQIALGKANLLTQLGTSVLRSFRTYQVDDRVDYSLSLYRPNDHRIQLNEEFKDGIFIKTSLIYRLDLGK